MKYRVLVNQITVKYGSGSKGFARLQQFLEFIVGQMVAGKDEQGILMALAANPNFSYLQPGEVVLNEYGKDFSTAAKSEIFLRDAIKDALRCGICGSLMHRNAISIDHKQRVADGGMGDPENGQLAHPFCNTTVKN